MFTGCSLSRRGPGDGIHLDPGTLGVVDAPFLWIAGELVAADPLELVFAG